MHPTINLYTHPGFKHVFPDVYESTAKWSLTSFTAAIVIAFGNMHGMPNTRSQSYFHLHAAARISLLLFYTF